MNLEKKFIQVFKTFIEKTLVPQIKKFEGSLTQWNKFCSIISADNLNFSELQLYVDSITSQGSHLLQKPTSHKKGFQNQGIDFGTFNPSKTFGGERNKLNIFQVSQQSANSQQRQDTNRARSSQNPNNITSGLEKLLRTLEENQSIIENLYQQTTSRQPSSATVPQQNLPTHTNNTSSVKNMGVSRESTSYGSGHYHSHSNNQLGNNYSYSTQPHSNQAYYKSYH